MVCKEYIILAYKKETYEWLEECGYKLSPQYFMRVKVSSKLGKDIKKEVKKQIKELKQTNEAKGK